VTKTAGVPTEALVLIVDDVIGGTRAYRVESFEVDVRLSVLRPVFDGGKTIRDLPKAASLRLCYPGMAEGIYPAALELLAHPKPDGLTTSALLLETHRR
jgi:hypothetical protein